MALPYVTEAKARLIAEEVVKENTTPEPTPTPTGGGTKLYKHTISVGDDGEWLNFVIASDNPIYDSTDKNLDEEYILLGDENIISINCAAGRFTKDYKLANRFWVYNEGGVIYLDANNTDTTIFVQKAITNYSITAL